MKFQTKIRLLMPLLLLPTILFSQKILDPVKNPPIYKTEVFRADDGLSSPLLRCLYEDKYGFIWVGTQYGLDRYDGYQFTHMDDVRTDSTTTSMEWVWSIDEDRSGMLWVCSSKGLFRYDRLHNSFEMLLPDSSDPTSKDNIVYAMKQDSRGTYWLFTLGGLFSFDRETNVFKDYKEDSIITDETRENWNDIYWWNQMRFCEDQSGTVWIGSYDGLKKYDHHNDHFITYRHNPEDPQSITGNNINCISEDKYGTVWISTYSTTNNQFGLSKMLDKEEGIFKQYYHDETEPNSLSERCFPIYVDTDSNLWVGSFRSNGRFSRYNY